MARFHVSALVFLSHLVVPVLRCIVAVILVLITLIGVLLALLWAHGRLVYRRT